MPAAAHAKDAVPGAVGVPDSRPASFSVSPGTEPVRVWASQSTPRACGRCSEKASPTLPLWSDTAASAGAAFTSIRIVSRVVIPSASVTVYHTGIVTGSAVARGTILDSFDHCTRGGRLPGGHVEHALIERMASGTEGCRSASHRRDCAACGIGAAVCETAVVHDPLHARAASGASCRTVVSERLLRARRPRPPRSAHCDTVIRSVIRSFWPASSVTVYHTGIVTGSAVTFVRAGTSVSRTISPAR